MKRNYVSLLCAGLLAMTSFVFTACQKDDDPVDTKTYANVMVVHASPNAQTVDVLVDDAKVTSTPLAFPNNTGYLQVESGNRNIKVNPAGTTASVINANANFTANKNYTVIAVDSVSKITPIIYEDDLTTPATGKAHVRFIHVSPNAPAVDLALTGGNVVFPNIGFKEGTTFLPLDAGTYNFEARVAGTNTVALTAPNLTFQAGKIYTVLATGFLGGTGTQALGTQVITNR